jgi:hypothetical protein
MFPKDSISSLNALTRRLERALKGTASRKWFAAVSVLLEGRDYAVGVFNPNVTGSADQEHRSRSLAYANGA